MNNSIQTLYNLLFSHFGDTGWWPAESPDEIIMGTILTQNTSWNNVEVSLRNMKAHGILTLLDLSNAKSEELGEIIRSSGFYRQKSSRLINISRAILEKYGNLKEMGKHDTEDLKIFLSKLNGVGQETMDCILLYVLEKPEFVVDKYTLRILRRTGIVKSPSLYEVKQIVEIGLSNDIHKLKNFHGMFVELAKNFCRVKPQCGGCPLIKKCDYGQSLTK